MPYKTIPIKATYGDTIINVYGFQGQEINALADKIEQRVNASVTRRGAVFAQRENRCLLMAGLVN